MLLSRSDCAVRLAVVLPISRPQKQRRRTDCFVFLEDDAVAEGLVERQGSSRHGYTGAADDPLVKGALSNAQLQAAVTQVIGPHGFGADEGNEDLEEVEEQDGGEESAQASYSDVWGEAAVDKGTAPYHELGRLIDDPMSEEAGRADVRALDAMSTRLQKAKLVSGTNSTLEDSSLLEDAEGVQHAAVEAVLLPEIQHPAKCKPHRMSNDTTAFLSAMTESSKFRDRWTLFSKQLHSWGYHDTSNPAPKRTMTNFSRSNPDLLHMLPVRGLHIFVKKFRAFPSRSLDRKFRAAAARLANVYVDFQIQPTFNGNACFQDVARLLLFVATSEFASIEETSPGIVAASSDLLVEILVASTQPPSKLARGDHSEQWGDLRDSFALTASKDRSSTSKSRKRVQRKQQRSSQLHDEEAELAAERRLESIEEKLAANLRKGGGAQGSPRPWTPWDDVSKDSGYGSSNTASSLHVRHANEESTNSRVSSENTQRRHSEDDDDVWGADVGRNTRCAERDAGADNPTHSRAAPASQRRPDSRMDFMSLVGDGAVDGARSKEQACRRRADKRSGGGNGAPGGGGYSGGVGLL